jgi:hypothetical protein
VELRYAISHCDNAGCHPATVHHIVRFPAPEASTTPTAAIAKQEAREEKSGHLVAAQTADSQEEGREGEAVEDEDAEETRC